MLAEGRLVTFGVVPDRPETGFGYIRCGEALSESTFTLSSLYRETRSSHSRKPILKRALICGIAACFCFVPIVT